VTLLNLRVKTLLKNPGTLGITECRQTDVINVAPEETGEKDLYCINLVWDEFH
jgi:hypothetical protein